MGITRKRDLRSGQALWSAYRQHEVSARRLRRGTSAEVVVGAGISGALISQALKEVGIHPLILDRRKTGLPANTRIPALLCRNGVRGNGITFSMLAASLITAEIPGKPDPAARLFAFR